MPFITEPEPPRGVPEEILPGIRRIVARNPSVMTYHGTNTYLLERDDGLTIIDPGPDDAQHVEDIIRAIGTTPVARIVLTHAHSDHYGATKALRQATGAPTWGYHTSGIPEEFTADHTLDDGGEVAGLKAVFTPGHAPDHLSFAYHVPGTGAVLFSGDHVMSWSSSIVNPPKGNMLDYYRSLEILLDRQDKLYLPGHGPVLPNPQALVDELLKHRQMREAAILTELKQGPWTVGNLAEHLYAKTDFRLKMAAQRNVLAHLLKLQQEGRVVQDDSGAPPEPQADSSGADDVKTGDSKLLSEAYIEMARIDSLRQFREAA